MLDAAARGAIQMDQPMVHSNLSDMYIYIYIYADIQIYLHNQVEQRRGMANIQN